MHRSELVTVPSFSPHPVAGRSTFAVAIVSVLATQSETTTKGHFSKAAFTRLASGMLTTGLVAIIQMALILPSSRASNRSTAFNPGAGAIFSLPQKRPTRSRSSAEKSICAAS